MTPDKHIRGEVIRRLRTEANIFASEEVVPISVETPRMFATIGAQSRQRTAVSKNNYEWLSRINITLVRVNEKGYISSADLDDAEGEVIEIMDSLQVPGYVTNFSRMLDSVGDKIETPDSTLSRRTVMYEIWVNRKVNA